MSNAMRRLVPSMFARRLLFIAIGAAGVVCVLGAQLAWLTLAEGAQRRVKAEAVLESTFFIPTVRGRILDCKGRVLAGDRASYDVAVDYSVITGDWAYARARAEAFNANRYAWNEMSPAQRDQQVSLYQQAYEEQINDLWHTLAELGGIDVADLHERRAVIIRRVQQVATHMWVVWQRLEQQQADGEVKLRDVARPIREEHAAHALLFNVDAQTRVRVSQLIADAGSGSLWKQVAIVDSRQRVYPYEKVTVEIDKSSFPGQGHAYGIWADESINIDVIDPGLHVLGSLRQVSARDIENRPFTQDGKVTDLGGYRPGDDIGSWGLEKSQEQRLRGVLGDRVRDNITGDTTEFTEPKPGRDVELSLDIFLQARIAALMSHDSRIGLMRRQQFHERRDLTAEQLGQPLNGAAVVMDVATGQIRAAVSVPPLTRQMLDEDYDKLRHDFVNLPLMNRPIGATYQPGSTVKPLVLAAAVTDRKVGYDETIECTGALDMSQPDAMRCWIYKVAFPQTHGLLNGPQAVQHSCNIFFFTLGRRLKGPRLVQWFERIGLGHPTGCGIDEEVGGILPDLARRNDLNAPGFALRDATMMGIGQGPVGWTLMQAAKAYATLARQGSESHPTLLSAAMPRPPHPPQDWSFDPKGVAMALEGMKLAANDPTGGVHHLSMLNREPIFNLDAQDVTIYAKSGTADTYYTWIDENADGKRDDEEVRKRGDHAWTICLVQKPSSPRPDYVVVVVVEYGGSGAATAGPIANQILHAMQAEDYL
jgi:penicillin-binding protein 2